MNVTLIHGQNHVGSTCRIGRMLAERLAGPEEIAEIFLPRDMPHFCTGCARCFETSETLCPHHAQLQPLTEKLDGADLLIFTSPVYVYHATGSMKAFLDHYGYRWMVHRPDAGMFHKQAAVIATAAGAGMRSACKDIADSCFFWGIPKIYRYGVAVAAVSWGQVSEKKKTAIDRRIDALAAKIKGRAGRIRPGLKTQLFFSVMRMLQRRGWNQADVDYWRTRGWDGRARPWHSKQEQARV